jgi:hypothetical protein
MRLCDVRGSAKHCKYSRKKEIRLRTGTLLYTCLNVSIKVKEWTLPSNFFMFSVILNMGLCV